MQEEIQRKIDAADAREHYSVAFIGGFLGVYPVLNFQNFYASAQTVNLYTLVLNILDLNGKEACLYLIGALLYILAVVIVTYLPKHSKVNVRYAAMVINAVTGVAVSFFPSTWTPIVASYPIFFAMAFQWCSFKGAYGYGSSTIFNTNNLRQFSSALAEIYLNHDESFRTKAKFYGLTILFFHLGVAICYFIWQVTGHYAGIFILLPIAVSVYLIQAAQKTRALKIA